MSKLPSSPSPSTSVAVTIEIPVKCAPPEAGVHMDSPYVVLRLSVEVIAVENPLSIPPQTLLKSERDNPLSPRPASGVGLRADFAYDQDDFEKNWLDYSGECG